MMTTYAYTVPGAPGAKPRPRAVVRGWKPQLVQKDCANGFLERCAYAANAARPARPLDGPVSLTIVAVFPWSAAHLDVFEGTDALVYHIQRPDCDNLAKGVMDTMNPERAKKSMRDLPKHVQDAMLRAGWWHDDCQVAELHVQKIHGDEPRTVVTVRQLVDATTEVMK